LEGTDGKKEGMERNRKEMNRKGMEWERSVHIEGDIFWIIPLHDPLFLDGAELPLASKKETISNIQQHNTTQHNKQKQQKQQKGYRYIPSRSVLIRF
jgi:hypothetical protein